MDDTELDRRRHWLQVHILPIEPRLYAYAARLAHGSDLEADELVHETLLHVFERAQLDTIENPAAYAVRTLHNLAMSALRRRKVVSIQSVGGLAELEPLGGGDSCPGPDAALAARQELAYLQRAIAALPPQCRRVVTLRKVYSLPLAEVAERLGISVSTAEKHLAKGLRLCAERLVHSGFGEADGGRLRSWRKNKTQT